MGIERGCREAQGRDGVPGPRAFAAVLALGLGLGAEAFGSVSLAAPFGDHMVLQRNTNVTVWGQAAPGESVTVRFQGQSRSAVTSGDGAWRIEFAPLAASNASELTVQGTNTLTLKDVSVGEVWLASGQSNMAMAMHVADSSLENVSTADFPLLRFNGPHGWSVCSPANAGGYSAVAFYFGRELQKRLGIPIGMVVRAVGGTRIEQWMDPGAAQKDPALRNDTSFSGLYVLHIAPLIPMAFRGAIWYQGESNETTPDTYRMRLPALIQGWRQAWGPGDFPFYLVQLPLKDALQMTPQGDGPWPLIREAQRLALALPNTGLAVALDVGAVSTVHPLNKYPVGYRLSLIARAREYGEANLTYSGPLYKSMAVHGSRIDLRFDPMGGGLTARGGGAPKGFAIAGSDGQWAWADARIHGDTITVSSPSVPAPVQVHYAWSQNPVFNLYNAEGLPASPFRTEGPQLPMAMAGEHRIPARSRKVRAGTARSPYSVDASGRRVSTIDWPGFSAGPR